MPICQGALDADEIAMTHTDVRAGRPNERRVRRREADIRLDLAMEVIEGGYWHYDVGSSVFETSPHLARFVEGEAAEPLDLSRYTAHVLSEDIDRVDISRLASGELDSAVSEYRVRVPAGSVRWMRCRRRLIRDEDGRPVRVVGVAMDITEQKNLHAWIERQAKTDPLTELGNRRGFEEHARTCLLRAKTSRASYMFGLIMLDLDHFKPINDEHGHLAGDGILKMFAHRLRGAVRPIDYVARLGGDEFAILVDDANDQVLSRLAERVVRVTGEPMEIGGHTFEVGCSVGVTRSRAEDTMIEFLIGRADAALYEAKHQGRGDWKLSA